MALVTFQFSSKADSWLSEVRGYVETQSSAGQMCLTGDKTPREAQGN
jgi:hypothetical protein